MATSTPTVTITTPACMVCNQTSEVTLPAEQYDAYSNGAFLQDAFSDRNADERELIKSGIHPECWFSIFGDEDDD